MTALATAPSRSFTADSGVRVTRGSSQAEGPRLDSWKERRRPQNMPDDPRGSREHEEESPGTTCSGPSAAGEVVVASSVPDASASWREGRCRRGWTRVRSVSARRGADRQAAAARRRIGN